MSRVSIFANPLLLGFDAIEQHLDRLSRSAGDGYPPYNIERLRASDDRGEALKITLAVAGFSKDELDVSIEENQLIIRGKQNDDETRSYLHRGIAARQFQRTFVLADGIDVTDAELANGLLTISLFKPEPEQTVRKISITEKDD
ncbi:MAG: Hsp20 family protein [Gammaproteobacteria bacterium]|nr:Hsp20 family protein [Gammaproteobacteria bacterium]